MNISTLVLQSSLLLITFFLFRYEGVLVYWLIRGIISLLTFLINDKYFQEKHLVIWDVVLVLSIFLLYWGYETKNVLVFFGGVCMHQFSLRFSEYLHNRLKNKIPEINNPTKYTTYKILFISLLLCMLFINQLDILLLVSVILRIPIIFIILYKGILRKSCIEEQKKVEGQFQKILDGFKQLSLLTGKSRYLFVTCLVNACLFRVIEIKFLEISVLNHILIFPLFLLLCRFLDILKSSFLKNTSMILSEKILYIVGILYLIICLNNSSLYGLPIFVLCNFVFVVTYDQMINQLLEHVSERNILVIYSFLLVICNVLTIALTLFYKNVMVIFIIVYLIYEMRNYIVNSRYNSTTK